MELLIALGMLCGTLLALRRIEARERIETSPEALRERRARMLVEHAREARILGDWPTEREEVADDAE